MKKRKKITPRIKVVRDAKTGQYVIKALESDKYDYRTAEGIAKEVHASVEDVKEILTTDARIRVSVMKSKQGKPLYTLKAKKSAVGDVLSAIRAMSSDKLGS